MSRLTKSKIKTKNMILSKLQLPILFLLSVSNSISKPLCSCYLSKIWCYISFYYKCYLYTNWRRSWCSKELFILHTLCSKIVHYQHYMLQWGMFCCFKSDHYAKNLVSRYKDFTGKFWARLLSSNWKWKLALDNWTMGINGRTRLYILFRCNFRDLLHQLEQGCTRFCWLAVGQYQK